MGFPLKTVDIIGHLYQIVADRSPKCVEHIDPSLQYPTGCKGLVDYGEQVIYLDVELPPEQLFQTLIHECLHAIDHHLTKGAIFSPDSGIEEEGRVDLTATGFFMLFKHNNLIPLIQWMKQLRKSSGKSRPLQKSSKNSSK